MQRAEYEIRGKTRHDQAWIDDEIEGGVGGCGFERPKPRPKEWDTPQRRKPAVATAKPAVIRRTDPDVPAAPLPWWRQLTPSRAAPPPPEPPPPVQSLETKPSPADDDLLGD